MLRKHFLMPKGVPLCHQDVHETAEFLLKNIPTKNCTSIIGRLPASAAIQEGIGICDR
jgi:hypothetical protein